MDVVVSEYRQQVQCEAHVSQQSLPVLQICTPVLAKVKAYEGQ